MAITNHEITTGQTVDVLLVPAGKTFAVTGLLLCNTAAVDPAGGNDSTFTIYAVANGEAPGNKNIIVNSVTLPGAETFTLDTEKLILAAGDKVRISVGGASNVASVVSYLEV
jgi:hypothetical protein